MHSEVRIIDANANRAREGLRVLEDIARFMLDRGDLTELAKRLRHEVTAAIGALGIDPVRGLAARDTSGDVGTGVSTPSTLCSFGLVVVYCRWIFLSGKMKGAAPKAASAHS